jgi:hypothetical protein
MALLNSLTQGDANDLLELPIDGNAVQERS